MNPASSKPQGIVAINPDLCRSAQGSRLLVLCGNNTGNLFFTEAVYSQVESPSHVGFDLDVELINSEYSSLIIPAANWINDREDLDSLPEKLEQIEIPICCVGLGSQLAYSEDIKLKPRKTRFLIALSEKSNLIGVRDPNTQAILSRLGIHNTLIVGCPSLFFDMKPLPVPSLDNKTIEMRLNVGFTRFLIKDADMKGAQQRLAALAASQARVIILQSEREEFMLKNGETISLQEMQALQQYYGCKDLEELLNVIEERTKIFSSTKSWIDYIHRHCDATLASRIHGCIASLNAGKPALLLHHDIRTAQLAEVIGLPSVPIKWILDLNVESFRESILEKLTDLWFDNAFAQRQSRNLSALETVYRSNGIRVRIATEGAPGEHQHER